MLPVKNINELRLSDFLSKEIFEEREFTYSGVDGIAEVLGWHVIFFRDLENQEHTCAISIEDALFNKELSEFVNTLLAALHINLTIGDNFEKIKRIYGEPFSYNDELFVGTIRYTYLLNDNTYAVCLGVGEKEGLHSVEIITNHKMIQGILHENWR